MKLGPGAKGGTVLSLGNSTWQKCNNGSTTLKNLLHPVTNMKTYLLNGFMRILFLQQYSAEKRLTLRYVPVCCPGKETEHTLQSVLQRQMSLVADMETHSRTPLIF